MANIQFVIKKILINYLFLVKSVDYDKSEFEKEYINTSLSDIKEEVFKTIKEYDIKWLIFNLGVAFSWFEFECIDDEINVSVLALDEIYNMFDIKEPDDFIK